MANNKKLHIKLNWYTIITIGLSLISILALLLSLIAYYISRDINTWLLYVTYFFNNVQIIIIIITVIACVYHLFSVKRIENIDKQSHLKVYIYRFILLIISIIISLLLSFILLKISSTIPISDDYKMECMGMECLGAVAAMAMVYLTIPIAIFSTLVVNVVYLSSCFLADIVYCYEINKANTNSDAAL